MLFFYSPCDGFSKAIYIGREIGHGGYSQVYLTYSDSTLLTLLPCVTKLYSKNPPPDIEELVTLNRRLNLECVNVLFNHEVSKDVPPYYALGAPIYLVKDSIPGRTIGVGLVSLDNKRFRPISRYYGTPDLIRRLDLSLRAALRLVLLVSHIHRNDLIIGDLSDTNLVIDTDGNVGIIDCDSFVIAKYADRTSNGYVTPNWCPPEWTSEHKVSFSSDIFLLTTHVCKLLFAGAGPFEGVDPSNSEGTVQSNINSGKSWLWDDSINRPPSAPKFSRGLDDLPPSLRLAVRHSLSRHSDQRPQDCFELLAALEGALKLLKVMDCGHHVLYGIHCPRCGYNDGEDLPGSEQTGADLGVVVTPDEAARDTQFRQTQTIKDKPGQPSPDDSNVGRFKKLFFIFLATILCYYVINRFLS